MNGDDMVMRRQCAPIVACYAYCIMTVANPAKAPRQEALTRG